MPSGIGGGLGGAVIVANEAAYGTWVTPTRALEVRSAKLQNRRQDGQQGTALAYGRSVDPGVRRVTPWFDGGGTVEKEVLSSGEALLTAAALGSTTGLVQVGTTSAYKLIANYGVPDYGATPSVGSFSLQSLVPDTGGAIKQQNFTSCKIHKAEWVCARTDLLLVTYDIDAQKWDGSTAAVVPSYLPNLTGFSGQNMSIKVGAFGSEATMDGVRKITITLERALDVKRIYVGNASKSEPVTNGVTKIGVSLEVDLLPTNKATIWDIYNTQVALPSLVAQWTGPAIGSSGQVSTFQLNPTDLYADSAGTPELDSPDVTKATIALTGLIDSANDSPFIATYITSDTGY